MPTAQKRKVKNWMIRNVDDYVDRMTGEVNATRLAENAAQSFKLYEDDANCTIYDWVFDLAATVAMDFEDT